MTAHDLDPNTRSGAQLIDAMWRAFREGRSDAVARVGALVTHPSAVVRESAFALLLTHWKAAAFRPQALAALTTDEDGGVRATAVLGLASISGAATRDQDVRTLIEVLRNEREEEQPRRMAYEALLILDGRRDFPTYRRGFVPDRDFDWDFVRTIGSEPDSAG